jgi:uncharacterized protein YbjT (DUF2867 family)
MPQVKPVIELQVKRVVVGVGPDKKSAIIHRDSPNHQEAQAVAALGATLVGGDLTDCGALAAAVAGVDVVASLVPLVTSSDPLEAFDMPLGSIKHVIDATVEAGGGSRMFRGESLETTA